MSNDIEFAEGIYFNDAHEKAPDFVLGSISVMPDRFIEWLKDQEVSEKGYVRLKINRSKNGKPYIALDDWKPESQPVKRTTVDDDEEIPF